MLTEKIDNQTVGCELFELFSYVEKNNSNVFVKHACVSCVYQVSRITLTQYWFNDGPTP